MSDAVIAWLVGAVLTAAGFAAASLLGLAFAAAWEAMTMRWYELTEAVAMVSRRIVLVGVLGMLVLGIPLVVGSSFLRGLQ